MLATIILALMLCLVVAMRRSAAPQLVAPGAASSSLNVTGLEPASVLPTKTGAGDDRRSIRTKLVACLGGRMDSRFRGSDWKGS